MSFHPDAINSLQNLYYILWHSRLRLYILHNTYYHHGSSSVPISNYPFKIFLRMMSALQTIIWKSLKQLNERFLSYSFLSTCTQQAASPFSGPYLSIVVNPHLRDGLDGCVHIYVLTSCVCEMRKEIRTDGCFAAIICVSKWWQQIMSGKFHDFTIECALTLPRQYQIIKKG